MDPREKMKFLVFFLVRDYSAKQADVARVFKISPATVSLWMKEMNLRYRIDELEQEVSELRLLAGQYMNSGQIGRSNDYSLPQLF